MFWKKTEDQCLETKQEEIIPSSSSSTCCSRIINDDDGNMPEVSIGDVNKEDDNNTMKINLPPSNISPSKRCAHIMSIASVCADPIHFHSFTLVGSSGSSGWSIPSPKSLFVGAFQKCSACHGRLGGSTVANDIDSASNEIDQHSSSSGMLYCAACGIYAHRSCAFNRNNNKLPICEVNLEVTQKAFGLSRDEIMQQMNIPIPQPAIEEEVEEEETRPSSAGSTSSSWSIFGRRTLTEDEIKVEEEKMLEKKSEPTNTLKKDEQIQIQQQQPGVIQTSLNLIQKSTETSSNIPKASALGLVAGGAAGLVIAGPAGVVVGSQIGRTVLAGAALVQGGMGMSVLVMSLAAAANFTPNISLPSSPSSKAEKELVLVRPDIDIHPIWSEYANEARELWEKKYPNASSSSSQSKWPWEDLFSNTTDDQQNMRYRKDVDIIKAESYELPMKEKVFLLVNRILNDKTSLPGYLYRHLILKHKRRVMFGDEDTTSPEDADDDESIIQRSCRQDAHGITKHVTATLLEVRPGLASSPNMTELTASAVEVLIFGELYDDCFSEIILETEDKDDSLLAKVCELQKNCDDGENKNNVTSLDEDCETSNDVSSSVSQLAIGALQCLPQAHTPTDKLLHCVEFLEYVSEHFSSLYQGKCIDADELLIMVCQHVVAAKLNHLHAEVAFIEEFSRDEQLLSGKEGYALITLQASLHYLDSIDDLCGILSPKILSNKQI